MLLSLYYFFLFLRLSNNFGVGLTMIEMDKTDQPFTYPVGNNSICPTSSKQKQIQICSETWS